MTHKLGCECPLLARSGHLLVATHMSAFGGQADMTVCGNPSFVVAICGKADIVLRCLMSSIDPKRTSAYITAHPSRALVRIGMMPMS